MSKYNTFKVGFNSQDYIKMRNTLKTANADRNHEEAIENNENQWIKSFIIDRYQFNILPFNLQ